MNSFQVKDWTGGQPATSIPGILRSRRRPVKPASLIRDLDLPSNGEYSSDPSTFCEEWDRLRIPRLRCDIGETGWETESPALRPPIR
jgi:hypothetical protein